MQCELMLKHMRCSLQMHISHLYPLDDRSAKRLSQLALPHLSLDPRMLQGLLSSWPGCRIPCQQAAHKVFCSGADAIPASPVKVQLAIQNRRPADVAESAVR